MKKLLAVGIVLLFSLNLFSENLLKINKNEVSKNIPVPHIKYNQQNTALQKIKLDENNKNDSMVYVMVETKYDINYVLKDLKSYKFNLKSYKIEGNFYKIGIEFKNTSIFNIADNSVGLAKIYYVNKVLVSKDVYNDLFSLKNKRFPYATRIGKINGEINGNPLNLTYNKILWTVEGKIGEKAVEISINHDNKNISGKIGDRKVNLNFKWSPEKVNIFSKDNSTNYTAIWKKGILEGKIDGKDIHLKFDMKEDVAGEHIVFVKGKYNTNIVNIKFDKISGELTGTFNSGNINLKLINCDLYDFLQYIFIFF